MKPDINTDICMHFLYCWHKIFCKMWMFHMCSLLRITINIPFLHSKFKDGKNQSTAKCVMQRSSVNWCTDSWNTWLLRQKAITGLSNRKYKIVYVHVCMHVPPTTLIKPYFFFQSFTRKLLSQWKWKANKGSEVYKIGMPYFALALFCITVYQTMNYMAI